MGKWDFDEDRQPGVDGKFMIVDREFRIDGEPLAQLDRLPALIESMCEGLVDVETIEDSFGFNRYSKRSAIRWYANFRIQGARKMTPEEKAEYLEELEQRKSNTRAQRDRADMETLKKIQKRSPHLFKKLA